jgi:hypothetical protein
MSTGGNAGAPIRGATQSVRPGVSQNGWNEPPVDFFFNKAKQWQEEYAKLRTIVLGGGLTEELKWGFLLQV